MYLKVFQALKVVLILVIILMSFTIFLLIKMCTKIGQNKICYQINLEEILKNLEEILKTWKKY